jgi:adenosine deaminase
MRITRQQIARIPKSDLHVHLDGSLRLPTLIELARQQDVALPSYTEEGLSALVFKRHYADLPEYLQGFAYTCAVMKDPESVERIAFELAEDCFADGVRYIEVRFAPQLHVARSGDMGWVLRAVARGLEGAAKRFNLRAEVDGGADLPFEYGIICCAMRTFSAGMGDYYDCLLASLPSTPAKSLVGYASYELARAITRLRDDHGLPIVGFDIAGAESGHPAKYHSAAYLHCRRNFVGVTVHAGEAYGPESIYDAICECGATRIGHGTNLFAYDTIQAPDILDRPQFSERLAEYIARTRTTMEVCPTSNLQTLPSIGSLDRHPLRQMIAHKLSVAICTDNRLVSHTSVTDELLKVVEALDLDVATLRSLVVASFKGAFFPGSYARKRAYVHHAMTLFDSVFQDIHAQPHRSEQP